MDHNAFYALLNKYQEGKCTGDEERLIQQWYDLLDAEKPYFIHPSDWDETENKLWEQILLKKKEYPLLQTGQKNNIIKIFKWVAAASVILLGAITVYSITSDTSTPVKKTKAGWVIETNNTAAAELITLEDGSTVILQPGGRVEYPVHFAPSSREVFLEGEAFFEVKKNPSKAFFVYNKNLVTEVLGTSFNIIIRNNKIEVLVKTGRVAVYENGKRVKLKSGEANHNMVIVTPNQKVSYDTSNRNFYTSIVEHPVPLKVDDSVKLTTFLFDETPLSEVLSQIETTYGINLLLENNKMKLCPFSGDISQQDLYTKLQLICKAFNATYETRGVEIFIKGGRDCN